MATLAFSLTPELESLATRRTRSMFGADMSAHRSALENQIAGKRILVVGGAGSIGSSTLKSLLGFRPAAVHILDISENELAELVRNLRSRPELVLPNELRFLPLDYGSVIAERFLATQPPYDSVLVFAACKHVRSEKDLPSVLQMFDTNVVKLRRFLRWLSKYGHGKRVFSVSTDKAANPTSLMGASKRLMEYVLFNNDAIGSATSARFANVAFSNGSLLQSFLIRLSLQQPLAVPAEVKRYFVTFEEAAEICLLAAYGAPNRHVLFPNMNPEDGLVLLREIATGTLKHYGLTPRIYEDEAVARRNLPADLAAKQYPLIVTKLDTDGEKPYEEFVGRGEKTASGGFIALSTIAATALPKADEAIDLIERAISHADAELSKSGVVGILGDVIVNLQHTETGRSLDDRV